MLSPTTQNKNIFNGRQLHERTAAAPKRVSQNGSNQYREIALRKRWETCTPMSVASCYRPWAALLMLQFFSIFLSRRPDCCFFQRFFCPGDKNSH
jgi:hypothetical protein